MRCLKQVPPHSTKLGLAECFFSVTVSQLLNTLMTELDLNTVKELMAHRRSIKPVDMDASKEVSKDLLKELTECGNWAPSHGLTEPLRLHVFYGDARKTFAEGLQNTYKAETPADEFKAEKFEKMGKNVMLSHSVIAIVMERGSNPKIPVIEEVQAVACAIQNMHLAASAVGLGLYWSSPAVSYGEGFKNFLNIGGEDQCLGFLFVGWPKEGFEWPTSRRKPATDKLIWCE